jgi:hypothetical protein
MARPGVRLLTIALLCLACSIGGRAAQPEDRVWFCPSPGTLDYVQLFEHPEDWPHARQLVSVFKFYQQHTQMPAPSIVGPNTYDALARAGAFRLVNRWHKKIALEVGAVKEFFCTPDASGMNAAIAGTQASIAAVRAGGGSVAYLAMDEPFVSGRSRTCGGPALEPTADRIATYVAALRGANPDVRIGLIEAYPFSSAEAIERIIGLLKARGAAPAFLHMDVDWHLAGAAAFTRDMARLQAFAAGEKIPFGVIITGYNGNADPLYAADVYGITGLMADTFGDWNHMPDQVILQSWAESSTGLLITPVNLPEDRPYTHTSMLWDVLRRLRGGSGAATGTAIIRR